MANAINEAIKEKINFALQDNSVPTWPLRVGGASALLAPDPILADMQAAGYLKITSGMANDEQGDPVMVEVITPTEEAKKWWNGPDGFCVGTKAVAEVLEWTEPAASGSSGQTMQVKYTWHLVDVPSWAKRPEFKNIPGMVTPVSDTIQLQKTNKGWKAVLPTGGLE